MLSKHHSCFGVFAVIISFPFWTKFSDFVNTQHKEGKNCSAELMNSSSNISDHYIDDAKNYFKIIFILQLCSVK